MTTTTEEIIQGIVEVHRAHASGDTRYAEAEDSVLTHFVDGLKDGIDGLDHKTAGEILVHLYVELAAFAGALRLKGYPDASIHPILVGAVGLAGVRMYRAAELGIEGPAT